MHFLPVEDSIVNGKLPPAKMPIYPVVIVVRAVQIRPAAVENQNEVNDQPII